jgi:hypothetical protein
MLCDTSAILSRCLFGVSDINILWNIELYNNGICLNKYTYLISCQIQAVSESKYIPFCSEQCQKSINFISIK